jgi:hypothetical protein
MRPGARVAGLTGLLDLPTWPKGMRVIVRKERPCRRLAAVHGSRRPPLHLFRHRCQGRTARGPGVAAPPPGPVRGPDPLRQGHRPAQPASAWLCPEPDLVRDHRAGLRAAGLDADTRPGRARSAVRAQEAAAQAVRLRRTHRPRRPAPAASPRKGLALGQPDRRQHPNPGPGTRLSSQNPTQRPERNPKGKWNPVHRRDSRAARLTAGRKPAANGSLPPLSQDHERLRLAGGRRQKDAVWQLSELGPDSLARGSFGT